MAVPEPQASGSPGEADISALEQQVAGSPHDLAAMVKLADAYRVAGRLQEALVPIKNVVKEASDHVQANLAMGRIYFEMKEYPKAALSFEVVLNKERSNVQARLALGDVYLAQEKYSRALKAFQKAAEEGGDSAPEVHIRLARTLSSMDRASEAFPHLQKAVELDQGNVEAYLELGNHYLDAKQPQEALEVFRKGLALDPNNIKLRTYVDNLS
jgi:tetratricopeptide (TPR) repeat protein